MEKFTVYDVRAMRGADCGSEHHLISVDLRLKLRTNRREFFDTVNLKQLKFKADKAIYLESLAKEAETAASKRELSSVYKITKELSSQHTSSSVPCKFKDGKVSASESQQLEKRSEHFFKETLNTEHQGDDSIID